MQLPTGAKNGADNLFASAVADAPTGDAVVRLMNYSTTLRAVKMNLAGAKKVGKTGRALIMASDDLNAINSIHEPKKLTPKEKKFSVSGPTVSYTLAPNSFTVLRIPGKKLGTWLPRHRCSKRTLC